MTKLTAAGLLAAVHLAVAATAAAAPPPAEAFAQLPEMSRPHLSPDGTQLSYIKGYQGRPAVAVIDLSAAEPRPLVMPSDDWMIGEGLWASNERLILMAGVGQKLPWASSQLWTLNRAIAINKDGEQAVGLLANNESTAFNTDSAFITDLTIEEPRYVFMPLYTFANTRAGFRNILYQVDVMTGEGVPAVSGTDATVQWIMDGRGSVVARVDETRKGDSLLLNKDGTWSELLSVPGGLSVAGLVEDGSAIAAWMALTDGRRGLGLIDLNGGKEGRGFAPERYDVAYAVHDEWTGRVVGAAYAGDKMETAYFEPVRAGIQAGVEATFPGTTVAVESLSYDKKTAVVSVEGPRHPTDFFLVDVPTGGLTILAHAYSALAAKDLGETKVWHYKARDGMPIPAYLTLPPGKAAKNLPLVVMPHGGPDARDVIRFDWWAQFLASRGYAVLQPNYRGSAGYGTGFTHAGLRQWGLKMQDDISDGVLKAIADGIADPKRVCIVGASYGGYAALAGATLTPELYACAASVAGVSDLPEMIRHERKRYGRNSEAVSFWISRIGHPSDDSDQLRATSPARLAANVRAPILLMHGELDTTVPIEQSELMHEALTDAGKAVSFVPLPGDDHYLQLAGTRLTMLKELEKFLAANIGN